MTSPRHPRRHRHRRDPMAAGTMLRRYTAGGPGRGGRGGPAGGIGGLAQVWPAVVGDAAAAHSVPIRRSRAGMVTVACSSAAWAQELTARRQELAERLRAQAPEETVSGLRFVVGDHVMVVAPSVPEPPPPPPPPRPGPAERAAGERAAEGIGDETIRRLVERAAAVAAAKARKG